MNNRLTKPLQRIDNQLVEISFEEAFEQIAARIRGVSNEENLFVAGGGAPNELLYLVQRFARAGVKSNALTSFEYFARGKKFCFDKNDIVPFAELNVCSRLFFIRFDEQNQHPEFLKIRNIQHQNHIADYFFNSANNLKINDFAAFFRAANFYLIKNDLAKGIFINGVGKNYDIYKQNLLSDNFSNLLNINELDENKLADFVNFVRQESAPVFVYNEEKMNEDAIQELTNFLMLLEFQAKTASGAIGIKRRANSQGLFDMGCFSHLCVGGDGWTAETRTQMEALYNTKVETQVVDVEARFFAGAFKNGFVFDDDFSANPYAEAIEKQLRQLDFLVVQAATMTPAARCADLILPATTLAEMGGTCTDSARMAHTYEPTEHAEVALTSIEQLQQLGAQLGLPRFANNSDIFLEYISFFRSGCRSAKRHFFTSA